MKIKIKAYTSSLRSRSELLEAHVLEMLTDLVRVINPKAQRVTQDTMLRFLLNGGACVIAKTGSGRIVGVATLVLSYKLNRHTARLEHVAVLPEYRGQKIAQRLVVKLIEVAKALNSSFVDLTCESSRIAANNLYEKLGFCKRNTNARRLVLS